MLECYVDIIKVFFVANRCLKQIINFLNYKSNQRDIINVRKSSGAESVYLFTFNQNRNGSENFSKYSKYKSHGNLSGGSCTVPCRQAGGRTDMTGLRIASATALPRRLK
jgi:hypothetical protein